jgi:hypothetical protein
MAKKVSLREFRKAVSKLKKQGLVSKRLNVRKATPDKKVNGGRVKLSTLVKKFDDVISGKATAIKATKSLSTYRKLGFETAKGRVIVPHTATEQVGITPTGEIFTRQKGTGIRKIEVPVEYHKLDQYLVDILANAEKLNKRLDENEYFGFTYFGHRSTELYSNIEMLIAKIREYKSTREALRHPRSKLARDFKEGRITIVKVPVPNGQSWFEPMEERHTRGRGGMTPEQHRAASRKYRKKVHRRPEFLAAQAQRQKQWRDNLKGKARKEYLKESRKRSKQNRRQKK